MTWNKLTDAQWDRIKELLPPPARVGRPPTCRRQTMDAILWVLHHGKPWRSLPLELGAWRTIYGLYQTWLRSGKLDEICQELGFQLPSRTSEFVSVNPDKPPSVSSGSFAWPDKAEASASRRPHRSAYATPSRRTPVAAT